MPREFTHWKVAEKVSEKLQNTIFSVPLTRYKNILMLGANFHDIIFYVPRFFKKDEIGQLPDILHGSEKEDTFDIIKVIVDSVNRNENNNHLISFLIGVITHIFTDSTFHPMVFYYAGHYAKEGRMKKANQRHHKIEALIDFYLCKDIMRNDDYTLANFMNNAEYSPKKLFHEAFSEYFIKDKVEFVKAICSGYKRLSIVQKLAMNKHINRFFSIVEPFFPDRLKDASSIRYDTNLLNYISFVSKDIQYRNPVTGCEFSSTLDSLLEKSIEDCVSFCRMIEKFIIDKKHVEIDYKGPSLKAGIPSVSVKEMKYFYENNIFDKRIK
jgi:hypothetical protein